MPLTAGTRLGHYEVIAPIGAGGMGEVYKARDTRLNRQVAVKVLPEHVSHDAERKQRFEREAQTIASLDHPNICVLYDVGHDAGTDFLVMEYLEGQTLADRLQKGSLPLDEATEYATQIASALEKAHRKGVIHRDIKPANIMITAAGIKVLDFGLAKLRATESGIESHSAMPTQQHSVTVSGTILGTIQYMAPEQIEGDEITPRTDIFAFGAVLYEMVTGRKAFKGKSQASLMASILEHQPSPIAELQPSMPRALDHLIRTCMAKDPDQRWQTCADLGIQLRWIGEHGEDKSESGRKSGIRNRVMIPVIGLLAVAIVITSGLLILRPKPAPTPVVRFEISLTSGSPNQIAVSPDGRSLAAITGQNGAETSLWIRRLDQTEPQLLKNTNGVSFPFWSPDGKSIGFFADGKLKRIDASGGSPQNLCDAPNGRGGTWNRDGVILFSPTANGPLFRVAAVGGPATPVTTLDKSRQETAHLYPQFLPDGKHFIFLANAQKPEDRAIFAAALDSKETKRTVTTGFKAMYADPGYLLFIREDSLMVQPFSAASLELTGDPVPIAEKIGRYAGNLVAGFSVSDTGTLLYRTGDASTRHMAFIDRDNKLQSLAMPGTYWSPVLSPDGRRVAFEERTGSAAEDIWVLDLDRNTKSRLTFDPAVDQGAVWSPDGSQIVFSSSRDGGAFNLYQKSSGGAGEDRLLLKTNKPKTAQSWSMDGKYLVYDEIDSMTLNDVWALSLTGDPKPFPVIKTPVDEWGGQLSPDSKWIAYVGLDTGRPEIYIQDFPPSGTKYQISNMGADQPHWSRNGKELFFLTVGATGDLMSVSVEAGVGADRKPALKAGLPRKVVSFNYLSDRNNYDISPDGQRFLVNTTDEQALSPLNVILNWTSAIKH